MAVNPFILNKLKAKNKSGREKSILPPISSARAITMDKINIDLLINAATFLLLLFANQDSNKKTNIKIIIPIKSKFI